MELYNPLETGFTPNNCFLCGILLDDKNTTKEHIFPQWVINHFNLGNKHLYLLFNRKKVHYKQITVPCCRNCNSVSLAPLERVVRNNFIELRDSDFVLSDREICLWAGKVYYGILLFDYYDALKNIKDNDQIEFIKSYFSTGSAKILHIFLQSLIKPIEIDCYDKDFPVSIIHYQTQVPPHINDQFDFKTWPNGNSLLFRLGRRGFLISFDGGYLTKYLGFDFYKYCNRKLHPLQFNELAAHFMNLSQLKANNRAYLKYTYNTHISIIYLPDDFEHWYDFEPEGEEFINLFSFTTGYDKSFLLLKDGKRMTYLEDENGFFEMDVTKE